MGWAFVQPSAGSSPIVADNLLHWVVDCLLICMEGLISFCHAKLEARATLRGWRENFAENVLRHATASIGGDDCASVNGEVSPSIHRGRQNTLFGINLALPRSPAMYLKTWDKVVIERAPEHMVLVTPFTV